MFCLQYFLVVVFSLQLFRLAESQSNITQNAEEALNLLHDQIELSTNLISTAVPNLWKTYIDNSTDIILQQLGDDIKSFSNLVNKITPFALDAVNGEDCLTELQVYLDINNYNVRAASIEQQIFVNHLSLAETEVKNILKKYNNLNSEFTTCAKSGQNCDGINEGIVMEVERLIPSIKRIPNELLVETHLLGYRIGANWELIQSVVLIDYNKVIQNATVCLVSKIEDDKEKLFNSLPKSDDILKDYTELRSAVDKATVASSINLLYNMRDIMTSCQNDYLFTNTKIRDAIFKANQTINTLLSVPQYLNITANCSSPDLHTLVNSSLGRALNEYRLIINVVGRQHDEGVAQINATRIEIQSIEPQVHGCTTANSSCDYVSEKIASKTIEIPLDIAATENTTTLLMYQSTAAVWDSGSKIVRDILDELEIGIAALRSCIRLSFY